MVEFFHIVGRIYDRGIGVESHGELSPPGEKDPVGGKTSQEDFSGICTHLRREEEMVGVDRLDLRDPDHRDILWRIFGEVEIL